MNNFAIGILDSGMGGLSVWGELHRELPRESLIYFGDGANCPYGDRSPSEILSFVESGVERLMECGVKMVVVACNTATAVAIEHLRQRFPIPFVGMEPAVKPAALSTRSGVIGVLATRASFSGSLYLANEARYGQQVRIIRAVGEGFVELVERGVELSPEAEEAVRRVVEPLIAEGADRIVLGCTHYPFLKEQLRRVIGERDVEVIDPAPAVARRAAWLLDEHDMHVDGSHQPKYRFITSADDEYAKKLAKRAFEMGLDGPEDELFGEEQMEEMNCNHNSNE